MGIRVAHKFTKCLVLPNFLTVYIPFATARKPIANMLSQVNQNSIFVFAVTPTDTQAAFPLQHCFHEQTFPS